MLKKMGRDMALIFLYEAGLIAGVVVLSRAMEAWDVPAWLPPMLLVAAIVLFALPLIGYPLLGYYTPRWFTRLQLQGTPATAEVLSNEFVRGGWGYEGADILVAVRVRVEPAGEPPFEGQMRCRLSQALALKPGARVTVRYDPRSQRVALPAGMAGVFEARR